MEFEDSLLILDGNIKKIFIPVNRETAESVKEYDMTHLSFYLPSWLCIEIGLCIKHLSQDAEQRAVRVPYVPYSPVMVAEQLDQRRRNGENWRNKKIFGNMS
jgi:hypothetical protein